MRPLSIREAPPPGRGCGGSFHRLCVLQNNRNWFVIFVNKKNLSTTLTICVIISRCAVLRRWQADVRLWPAESDVLSTHATVSPTHVPHHAAWIVVQMSAVGTLQLRGTVHDLVTVNQLRVGVGIRTVRTAIDGRLDGGRSLAIHLQLFRPENNRK